MGVTKYKGDNVDAEKLQRFVDRHGCDEETARNYFELRAEHYTKESARMLAGLAPGVDYEE